MNSTLLGLWAWLTILTPASATTASLVGYKSTIRTIVFEDGSISRLVRIALTANQTEALAFKKDFLARNGYTVTERTVDGMPGLEAMKIFVPTPSQPILSDQFSRIRLYQVRDTVFYHEEFFTAFLMNEVDSSDLKNDHPAAKVLLADTQLDFLTILPGRITSAMSGDFSQDSITWSFDVERMFAHTSFIMTAQSSVARQEELSWMLLAAGIVIILIGLLLLVKASLIRRTLR